MTIIQRVREEMTGRLAMTDVETTLLIKYASIEGDYVEIGCLWGGTAIIAALAKKAAGVDGNIYTIDKMTGGFWINGDPGADNQVPTYAAIRENMVKFGIADRVTVIKSPSDPLPLPDYIKPTAVLIDGAHDYEGCLQDWINTSSRKPDYVMFHDYNTGKHPGIKRVVDDVVRPDTKWRYAEQMNTLIIFGRVK